MTYIQPILCLQTPTRAATRLCAFRLVVFVSVPPLSTSPLFWWKEWKAGALVTNGWKPHVSWGGWENQWPPVPRQLRCWRLQRGEMRCRLWIGKRQRTAFPYPHGRMASWLKGPADWASGLQQMRLVRGEGGVQSVGRQSRNSEWETAYSLLVLGRLPSVFFCS